MAREGYVVADLLVSAPRDHHIDVGHYHRGVALTAAGSEGMAIEAFNRAIELGLAQDPRHDHVVNAYVDLGRIFHAQEKLDQALWPFEKALALEPDHLQALYELLRGFQAAHDASGGELLRQQLDENPDEVYRALLTVILRLVFLLFAEERDMDVGQVSDPRITVALAPRY